MVKDSGYDNRNGERMKFLQVSESNNEIVEGGFFFVIDGT